MHRTRNPANQVFPWRAGSNPVLSLNMLKRVWKKQSLPGPAKKGIEY